jgi:hypothetical protein
VLCSLPGLLGNDPSPLGYEHDSRSRSANDKWLVTHRASPCIIM